MSTPQHTLQSPAASRHRCRSGGASAILFVSLWLRSSLRFLVLLVALVGVSISGCGTGGGNKAETVSDGQRGVAVGSRAGTGSHGQAVVFVEQDVAAMLGAPPPSPAHRHAAGDGGADAAVVEPGGWTEHEPSVQGQRASNRVAQPQPQVLLGGSPMLIDEVVWEELGPVAREIGPVYTEPGDLPYLRCLVYDEVIVEEYVEEYELIPVEHGFMLPVKHTHVDASLVGPMARVTVEQQYHNPTPDVLEAVYVFPLPENSAVDGMKMMVGDKVIHGIVRERGEARAIYEEARERGLVAALLEQERPNMFTQSVANISPGADIRIATRYVQDLTWDNGQYEFVFPMVVGPRYVPPEVPDAHRITPPVLGRGERSGQDISLTLRADAGSRIGEYSVPTHDVVGGVDDGGKLSVRLADHDRIPNRDFVLRYDTAQEEPVATVLSEMDDGRGWFTMVVQPPRMDVDELVGTREFIFVVDVSGSMEGVPLEMSREMMQGLLDHLRPVDSFNIVAFSNGTWTLFDGSRPANQQNIEEALDFVGNLRSGGGTELLQAMEQALSAPLDAGMRRAVVVMTDGFVGNEDDVLSAVAAHRVALQEQQVEARIFTFGVGSSTNRHLIDGLARFGDGTAEYALSREGPQRAVDNFLTVMDYPVLTDVEIDFGDLQVDVEETYPAHVEDLFVSRPMVIHGRYTSPGTGKAVLRARRKGEQIEIPFEIELSDEPQYGGVLGTLWARAAVRSLERDRLYTHDFEAVESHIMQLGLDYGIVTRFTSLVAVDDSAVVSGGLPWLVEQGLEQPE